MGDRVMLSPTSYRVYDVDLCLPAYVALTNSCLSLYVSGGDYIWGTGPCAHRCTGENTVRLLAHSQALRSRGSVAQCYRERVQTVDVTVREFAGEGC